MLDGRLGAPFERLELRLSDEITGRFLGILKVDPLVAEGRLGEGVIFVSRVTLLSCQVFNGGVDP
jgi:hypothetical protein